jgi:hypothetical protein
MLFYVFVQDTREVFACAGSKVKRTTYQIHRSYIMAHSLNHFAHRSLVPYAVCYVLLCEHLRRLFWKETFGILAGAS